MSFDNSKEVTLWYKERYLLGYKCISPAIICSGLPSSIKGTTNQGEGMPNLRR